MTEFMIRLAGVNIEIKAEYIDQKKRMKEYVIDESIPSFTVQANEEDKRENLRKLRLCNGDEFTCSDSYLEFITLHSLIADALLDYDVLLMHGSCLSFLAADSPFGVIFTASSGTGKSTHSRLWREVYKDKVKMVNDDKPLLKCEEDKIIAFGTPWNGKEGLGENTSVEVKTIAFLERGVENIITPVKPQDVFEKLYIQTYHSKDSVRAVKAMELLSRITRNVKMYKLAVNMEPQAAVVACEGMISKD